MLVTSVTQEMQRENQFTAPNRTTALADGTFTPSVSLAGGRRVLGHNVSRLPGPSPGHRAPPGFRDRVEAASETCADLLPFCFAGALGQDWWN